MLCVGYLFILFFVFIKSNTESTLSINIVPRRGKITLKIKISAADVRM